jgi:hypothetical protein
VKWLHWIRQERDTFKKAPLTFLTIAALSAVTVYVYQDHRYAGQVSTQQADIEFLKTKLSESEAKLAAVAAAAAAVPGSTEKSKPSETPVPQSPLSRATAVAPAAPALVINSKPKSHDLPAVPPFIAALSDEALKQKAYYASQQLQRFAWSYYGEENAINSSTNSLSKISQKIEDLESDS